MTRNLAVALGDVSGRSTYCCSLTSTITRHEKYFVVLCMCGIIAVFILCFKVLPAVFTLLLAHFLAHTEKSSHVYIASELHKILTLNIKFNLFENLEKLFGIV